MAPTHPFDVAKTRIQTAMVRGAADPPGAHSGTWGVLRHLYVAEGLAGLFVGWQPRLVRVAPACALMITSYEATKWFFATLHRQ